MDSLHTKSHSGKVSPLEKFYLRMSFQSTAPVDASQISLLYKLKLSKFLKFYLLVKRVSQGKGQASSGFGGHRTAAPEGLSRG